MRQRRDGVQRVLGEPQAHVLEFEQPLVLLDDGVLRLAQNLDQRRLSRSSSVATTGMRPMNSGMKPYLIRSCGCSCAEQIEIAAVADAHRLAGSPDLPVAVLLPRP